MKTFDPVADIEEFHQKFCLEYKGPPRTLTGEMGEFRYNFLQEEVNEYGDALTDCDVEMKELGARPEMITQHLEAQLDALVDQVYVALGNAYLHGFDFREAWRRVHAANMAKVRAQRAEDSKRGTTFDVVKPPGWIAPRHVDLVNDHAHRNGVDA